MDVEISVLMSVYKEPVDWLRKSIGSILCQTFTDFEFIIVCDNPEYKDGISLLNEYSEKDKRIVLIFNEENIGLTKSLNKGLKNAHGKYIARMDADDISESGRLEIQRNFLDSYPDISVCGTGRKILFNDRLTKKTYNEYTDNDDIQSVFVLRSPFTHPTVMFRRDILNEGFFYNESFECAQDYELWSRLLERGHRFANINTSLLRYRMSNQQVSKKKKSIQVKNAKLIRRNFLKTYGVNLSESELDTMVLPFVKDAKIDKFSVKNYIELLVKIQIGLQNNSWFRLESYQTEAFRFALNLALSSKERWSCIKVVLYSPFFKYRTIKNNYSYYLNRIIL